MTIVDEFRPVAERYRRRLRAFLGITAAGLCFALLAIVLPDALVLWFGIPAVVCIAGGLLLYFAAPGLVCPSCQKLADSWGTFCPVCGSPGIVRHQVTARYCGACHRVIGSYKYRNYRIHFCPHCGVLLAPGGV